MKYMLGEKHPSLDLFRVVALKDFGSVKAGDVGGWVGGEQNLSQDGDAWVSENAKVFDMACVYENAHVHGKAKIFDKASISGSALVFGNACVYGNSRVYGKANVFDGAKIYQDARIFGNAMVFELARVAGGSVVCRDAKIHGKVRLYGDSWVSKGSRIFSNKGWVELTDEEIGVPSEPIQPHEAILFARVIQEMLRVKNEY